MTENKQQSKLFNPANLLGKPEDEAKKICENFGYHMRVTSRDGQHYVVTCDYCTDRVNVGVTGGNISAVSGVG